MFWLVVDIAAQRSCLAADVRRTALLQKSGLLSRAKFRRLETLFDDLSMIEGERTTAPVAHHLRLRGVGGGLEPREIGFRRERYGDDMSSRVPIRVRIHSDQPHVVDFKVDLVLHLSPTSVFNGFSWLHEAPW
jgi:hypothetical protein